MENLYKRIGEISKLDKKNLLERLGKGTEELGEMAQAILSYSNTSGCGYKNLGKDKVIEETVDLLLVVYSILSDMECTEQEIKELANAKMNKWESKVREQKEKTFD